MLCQKTFWPSPKKTFCQKEFSKKRSTNQKRDHLLEVFGAIRWFPQPFANLSLASTTPTYTTSPTPRCIPLLPATTSGHPGAQTFVAGSRIALNAKTRRVSDVLPTDSSPATPPRNPAHATPWTSRAKVKPALARPKLWPSWIVSRKPFSSSHSKTAPHPLSFPPSSTPSGLPEAHLTSSTPMPLLSSYLSCSLLFSPPPAPSTPPPVVITHKATERLRVGGDIGIAA